MAKKTKTLAAKPAVRQRPQRVGGPRVTKITAVVKDAGAVRLRPLRSRKSEYEPIFQKLRELKPGGKKIKLVEAPVPDGLTLEAFQNRLTAAMRRSGIEAPKGYAFRKRSTENNAVAIGLVKTR